MARLFEHRIFPTGVAFATRALREAFEVDHDEPHRSVYILGAAQWILWYGQTLSSLVWQRIHSDARPEFPVTAEHSLDRFTTEKWKLWKTRFREYQGNDECAKVAQKAACLMDALEKNLTSPHVDQPSTT
ncbi:hypothetical protein BDV25DRAFT_150977 [Aspergillus avenaceus]|uniref:Uncharacterized protein n=1 Tax=Aspergillus avenaceus TaxID=36643 RepID=A0A5N6U2P1_ASPAV|nr:hypothetical protein BDV25DRAFT_150977 [Aspergillus avenaceus]